MRRSTAISLIAASLLAGIALGRAGQTVSGLIVLAGAGFALLAFQSRFRILTLAIFILLAGVWRTGAWAGERGQLAALVGSTTTLAGTIIDDPAQSPKGQVDFKLAHLSHAGHFVPGELSVHQYPVRVQRGYRVQITGKVRTGFGNAVAQMSFGDIQILSTRQDWLEQFRQRFFVGIRTALPEPVASFGLGLLVGIRALIPKDLQAELTLLGLSHLVAVSGYNLTIIVRAADRALKRFGQGIALTASFWLIAGFLVVTGASASIVRASLVSVLSLLAAFYGRRFHPVTLIFLTASATAAYDPKYLTDLGWLLSFLAFFGILVLAPAIEARLGRPKLLAVRLFIESLSAQILTLPLILCFFGNLSVVAPLTNLIILPFVPLAMALSFAAGLAGMIIPPFAGWLAWPASWLLSFMLRLIDAFAAIPWAGATQYITVPVMVAMYVLILVIVIAVKRINLRHDAKEATDHLLEPV